MITLIIGRREQGKTTLAYYQAEREPTVLIFDPRGMFEEDFLQKEAAQHGFDLYAMLDTLPRVVVHPEGDVIQSFNDTCDVMRDWLRDNPNEPVAFLVDEARFVKVGTGSSPSFDHITRYTAVKNVKIILTAHRPADIAVDLRAIADYWCVFHTTQEHDLEVIEERCGAEAVRMVRELRTREFLVWNDGKAKMHVVRNPSAWHVSLNPHQTAKVEETATSSNQLSGG